MRNSAFPKPLVSLRLVAILVLFSSMLVLAGWLTADSAAQTPPKKSATKEEQEETPRKKKDKEEQEEPGKTKRKTPLRVGDEDETKSPDGPAKGTTPEPADLAQEAKRARHPEVRELFRSLAKPHDVVTLTGARQYEVEPIAEYLGAAPKLKTGELLFRPIEDGAKKLQQALPNCKIVR